MVKILLSFFVTLFFNACSYTSPYRATKLNELIQDKHISIHAIDDSWKIDKEYNGHSWIHGLPVLYKTYSGFSYEIDFRTYPYRDGEIYKVLFNKNAQYWDSDTIPEVYDEIDKEQGINYKKGWSTYIKGVKCLGSVFSRNFGGTAYSATSKNYNILCGYYNKQEGKRLLEISYRYYGGMGDTELQTDKDDNTKEKYLTPQEVEAQLKQALKETLKTLKIKNFDKEKMLKEGLYHPNKEFESTKW
jgi:hypothetical protein